VEGNLLHYLPSASRPTHRRRRRSSEKPPSRGLRFHSRTIGHDRRSVRGGREATGSRDPYGLRRAAQGVIKILVDLPAVVGLSKAVGLFDAVERAFDGIANL